MFGIDTYTLLLVGLVSLSAYVFCSGVLTVFTGTQGKRVKDRLNKAGSGGGTDHRDFLEVMSGKLRALAAGLGSRLGTKDGDELSRSRLALVRAGFKSRSAPLIHQGAKVVMALTLPGLALVLKLAKPETSVQMLVMAAVFLALMGSYLPDMWLRSRATARRKEMMKELPDALDLLVVCVEAGMGLDQAIQRVSEEMRQTAPHISEEFSQLNLELRAGKRRHEALKDLSLRVGLEDLNSLVTLLIQADIFGISISKTLRVYSDTLRTKRFQKAEEKAAKLPAKLLLPLILCILPALLVIIMGPAVIQLMSVFADK